MKSEPGSQVQIRPRWRLKPFDAIMLGAALASSAYAIVTSFDRGGDLRLFYEAGQDWISGRDHTVSGHAILYPPFALPLFALPTAFQFKHALAAWLIVNCAMALLAPVLTTRLLGDGWPLRLRLYLTAFFLTWAPFRVTLRMGQNSLIVTVLLLGALLALDKHKKVLAGLLLALSLVKYSLTAPFLLYFVWKREWKSVASAGLLILGLTEVYAWHLGISAVDAWSRNFNLASRVAMTNSGGFIGTTGIRTLIWDLMGGNVPLTSGLTIGMSVIGLAAIAVVIARTPECRSLHLAILSLFALWTAYHRVYDAVLCIVPTALLIDLVFRRRFLWFGRLWLCGLGLLAVSIPGLLTARLGASVVSLSSNPIAFAGLHIERLLVFTLFWSLVWLGWRADPKRFLDEPGAAHPIQARIKLQPEASGR